MAYPASERIKTDAIAQLDQLSLKAKQHTVALSDASAAGNVSRVSFAGLMSVLTRLVTHINNTAGITGIATALVDQKPNFVGDVVAEAIAMRDAATVLRDWLQTNLDVPWEGQVQADGSRPNLTFTTAQTAPFRTEAAAFIATVG